ncbi:HD-GYP domain-containing protein [Conexibacter sp. DBS9H8]|uniref:HD-GYP domain-containing protein n=1 Tax=Conexibacter sp. DBS9H8 TaxID=2937801 RepID=UPI00200F24B1|nr:HD-GYP domain-containing protein [Conexibacter sp. DBS9H8]
MSYDSYSDPGAQALLRTAQERFAPAGVPRATLLTELAAAALFLAGAVTAALIVPPGRALSWPVLGAVCVVFLTARRAEFPVAAGHTWPAQLITIPMLFLLPLGAVPLITATLMLVDLAPSLIPPASGVSRAARVAARIADNTYILAPVAVLALFSAQRFAWSEWPVYLLAFCAQVGVDLAVGLARTWWAERILPAAQTEMLWLYLTDAALSCGGLQLAAVTVHQPGVLLLELPVIGLLGLFARERRERMDGILALSTAYRGTARLLGDVIEADDSYTGVHSRAVVDLSVTLADRLGVDAATRQRVEFGALLHDVGKIAVPREILHKAGPLDDAEWAVMRQHTLHGEEMLRQVGGTLSGVGRVVRNSHERWDGGGYPDGLRGEQIPIESRIIAVCDAFHAMRSDRPYRATMSLDAAVEELRRCAGSHFDPAVVVALLTELGVLSGADTAATVALIAA